MYLLPLDRLHGVSMYTDARDKPRWREGILTNQLVGVNIARLPAETTCSDHAMNRIYLHPSPHLKPDLRGSILQPGGKKKNANCLQDSGNKSG